MKYINEISTDYDMQYIYCGVEDGTPVSIKIEETEVSGYTFEGEFFLTASFGKSEDYHYYVNSDNTRMIRFYGSYPTTGENEVDYSRAGEDVLGYWQYTFEQFRYFSVTITEIKTYARKTNYIEPWVAYAKNSNNVYYNFKPLTFEIMTDGKINWRNINITGKTIKYSINNGDWIELTANGTSSSFSVSSGDIVKFKGNNSGFGVTNSASAYHRFDSTAYFKVSGNILSICEEDFYPFVKTSRQMNQFTGLFRNNTHLVDAGELILPIINPVRYSYHYMFAYCTNLKRGPKYVGDYGEYGCCDRMFLACTSLISGPETIGFAGKGLGEGYTFQYMFSGCVNLIKAPEFTASKSLSAWAHAYMFQNCYSLQEITLPFNTVGQSSYAFMFRNCKKLKKIKCGLTSLDKGTGGSLPTCQNWMDGTPEIGEFIVPTGYSGIWPRTENGVPSGWTIIEQ